LATLADIPTLVALENRIFTTDQINARSFRNFITQGRAAVIVEDGGGEIRDYVVLLFNRRRPIARIYTFAVVPEHRGKGLAKTILAESERLARKRGCIGECVEARKDNPEAQGLYSNAGYAVVGSAPNFYEDGMDSVKFEKRFAK
jgi:ribosomal protein S18 acetylase RimI-like enzyme